MLFLSFSLLVGVQTIFAGDEAWRAVTPAELQLKTPKVEADADAEAIFWEVRIDDSSADELSMTHYVRVKIFTELGREKFSKFDIPFIKGEKKIKDIAARIIKTDGTIIELTPKDFFEREVLNANKFKVRAKSFAVPNIEPGVIIEYRYKEIIEDAGANGMTLEFQKDIPVQTLSYYYKPFNRKEPAAKSYNFNDTQFLKNEKGYYLAERTNVPSFKQEPQMPPANNVRPWMQLQGSGANAPSLSEFSVGISAKDTSNIILYWDSVARDKIGLVKFMNKPDKELKKIATEITASATTDEEKLRKLYEFCQTQIGNVQFDPAATDEDKQKAYKQKTLADVLKSKFTHAGFLHILFGSMANSLGFETRIAYAGNRDKMLFDPRMTNESFIHRAAVAIRVGEDWKFFDPGTPFLPYGMLLWNEEDVWALVIGEDRHVWVKTPMSGIDKSVSKRTGRFKLSEDGTLEGDVRIEYNGQYALNYRLSAYDKSPSQREEDFKEEIKERISAADISNITIENLTDISKPLVYQCKIRVPNYAQKTGRRLFLQPGFFEYGESALFAGATRKYDIYFPYPWSEDDDIEIALPAGFTLDSAENPNGASDSSKIGRLKIEIGLNKDQTLMKYNRQFYFGNGGTILFGANVYQSLKNLFDEFQKNDSHTITLKQK